MTEIEPSSHGEQKNSSSESLPADSAVEMVSPAASAVHSNGVVKLAAAVPDDVPVSMPAAGSVKAASSRSLVTEAGAYLQWMQTQRRLWPDVPLVRIDYADLTYSIPVPDRHAPIPTVLQKAKDALSLSRLRGARVQQMSALDAVSGSVLPGTMTLILAPPGHGKSLLLKALSGQLQRDPALSGSLHWNGQTASQAAATGLYVNKLCAYVGQADTHLSLMTVRETLQFALDTAVASSALMADAEYAAAASARVDLMLDMLGLREAEHTIIGNELLRGVSGGQKRRVTLGEMLITNARCLLLDEVTTGLDSFTSFDILNTLRHFTRILQAAVVLALLQPTPECFQLFDRLILLRHGAVVYDGPVTAVTAYLQSIGVPVPDDMDLADFLTDFLTDPPAVYQRTVARLRKRGVAPLGSPTPALSTAALRQAFASVRDQYSSATSAVVATSKTVPVSVSAFTAAQFGRPYAHAFLSQFRSNLHRQSINMLRNRHLFIPRLVQAVVMGLILGGLFYQFSPSDYQARLGLIFFASTFISFTNATEIPHTGEGKRVVYKQLDAGFYTAASYILAVFVCHLPLSISEVSIFSLFLYFMTGFALDAGRFFFFLLAVWSIAIASSAVFRMLTYATPRNDVALQVAGPTIAFLFLFGGYLVPEPNIPRWLIWLFWLSPYSWYLRAQGINEFDASRYDAIFTAAPHAGIRTGDAYLREWGIDPTFAYKWAAVGYLWGFTLLFVALAVAVVTFIRYPLSTGTRRFPEEEQEDAMGSQQRLAITFTAAENQTQQKLEPEKKSGDQLPQQQVAEQAASAPAPLRSFPSVRSDAGSAVSVLPFAPVELVWRDISYSVTVEKDNKRVERLLLNGINGYAKAGELTALMGASGAGKTTLMDVIAGRKTTGRVSGAVLVNGRAKQSSTFNRLCGYVEQTDVHLASQTVREALSFSARLRLPDSVSAEQRQRFVQEVLDILELQPIADRIIGDAALAGLSPGQLKRVTIGVELVSNPSVLFLDEPTSGLDSRAALVVMRVVKRISSTGRAVVCTIHQPSAELFSCFDRLLLLGKGGVQCYFGPLGPDGEQLVSYLQQSAQAYGKRLHKPRTTNPASWMLDIISTTDSVPFPALYAASELQRENAQTMAELSRADIAARPEVSFGRLYATGLAVQLPVVCYRTFQFYWRNAGMVWLRVFNMTLLSVLFGFLYLKEGVRSSQDVVSQLSAVFCGFAFAGWSSGSVVIPLTIRKRGVYYRERASFIYSPLVYAASLQLVEIIYTALSCFIFLSCFYEMVGFRNDASGFFRYWLIEYLVLLVFVSVAQLCSSAMPNELVANLMSSTIFNFVFLFSGVYILAGDLPRGWKWVYYIFWIPKGLIAILTDQFYCNDDSADCPKLFDVLSPTGEVVSEISVSDFLLNYLDTGNWYWQYVGWLLLTYAVLQLFMWTAVAKVNHLKR